MLSFMFAKVSHNGVSIKGACDTDDVFVMIDCV